MTRSRHIHLPWLAALVAAACSLLCCCVQSEMLPDYQDTLRPVEFSAYWRQASGVKAETKAVSQLTTASLREAGFGVFAYYTDDDATYNSATSEPNFMLNQQVAYTDGQWTYSPVKYWPNEWASAGSNLGGGATSTGGRDRLTFFAYAPYFSSDHPVAGLSLQTTTGDPKIRYDLTAMGDSPVDLLWGTNAEGLPHLNESKPDVNTAIDFRFKHALASLKLNVQAVIDKLDPTGDAVADNTRITIDEVIVKAKDQVTAATLNLDNKTANKPQWEDFKTDGKQTTTYVVNKTKGNINTDLIDDGTGLAQSQAVTNEPQRLLKNEADCFPFIPYNDTQEVEVEAKYTVTTYDSDLAPYGGKWSVTNDITNTVSIADIEGGNQYTLNLLLGLESINFDVEVGPIKISWGDEFVTDIGGDSKTWTINSKPDERPEHIGDGSIISWETDDYLKAEDIWNGAAHRLVLLLENSLIYSYVIDAKKYADNNPRVVVQYKVVTPSNWYLKVAFGPNGDRTFIDYSQLNHTYTPDDGKDYEEINYYIKDAPGNAILDYLYGSGDGTPTGYISWYSGEGGPIQSGKAGYNPDGLNPFISIKASGVEIISIKYMPK